MTGSGLTENPVKEEFPQAQRSSTVPHTESKCATRSNSVILTGIDRFKDLFFYALTSPYSITTWLTEQLCTFFKTGQNSTLYRKNVELSRFQDLVREWTKGISVPLCTASDDPPPWLDVEKLRRGRAFALKYIAGLFYAEEISIVFLLSVPMLRKPLVFSEKSDTNDKAFRRYFSTVERLVSWYAEDMFDKNSKAYNHLKTVRRMHNRINHSMTACPPQEREKRVHVDHGKPSALLEALRADLELYLPTDEEQALGLLDRLDGDETPFLSQFGMALTQFAFTGHMVLCAKKFGGSCATEEDLDDFVYLWYVLGHQLGIEHRFNMCAGGISETRHRYRLLVKHVMLPSLAKADQEWEHMARAVVAGIHRILKQTSFEATLSYGLWALGVRAPRVDALVSWKSWTRQRLFRWVLCSWHKVPGVASVFSVLLKSRLGHVRQRLNVLDSQKEIELSV